MADADTTAPQPGTDTSSAERAAPIDSRFLFVDVAAQRAKQLRRGVVPRVPREAGVPRKLERLAMDEVRQGYILYTLPPTPGRRGDL